MESTPPPPVLIGLKGFFHRKLCFMLFPLKSYAKKLNFKPLPNPWHGIYLLVHILFKNMCFPILPKEVFLHLCFFFFFSNIIIYNYNGQIILSFLQDMDKKVFPKSILIYIPCLTQPRNQASKQAFTGRKCQKKKKKKLSFDFMAACDGRTP